MRFVVTMKSLLTISLILVSFHRGYAQDSGVRASLFSSKGNIKVSKLFNETPVLPINDRRAEIYRITIIPTFYNPIKVRVEKHKAHYFLVAKRLSGQGGYNAGKLKTTKTRRLKPVEWEHLLDLIRKADFWEMAYLDKEPEPNEKGEVTICLDGSEWVLEGVKNGAFHAVNRYCPDVKGFVAVGLYLVKLSGLRVRHFELY